METFARVKPVQPRQGFTTVNVHFQGNLYRGGHQPTWYKIDPNSAATMKAQTQASGAPLFDVVTTAEKVAIERAEEQARLHRLGLAAETVYPAPSATIDISKQTVPAAVPSPVVPAVAASPAATVSLTPEPQTKRRGRPRGARDGAVPESASGNEGSGDLSAADLQPK